MRTVLIASTVCLAAAGADATVNTSPKARIAAAARVVRTMQAAIPASYWDKARCVAAFAEMDNGNRMYQVGVPQLAVVLLVMTESAVQTLMRQKVTLGADVSVAP